MKNFFKNMIILIITTACSIMIVFYTRRMVLPRIVQHKTDMDVGAMALAFPDYNINKEITAQFDGEKFRYRTGIINIDGIDKKAFIVILFSHGYYCDMKLIAGVDDEKKLLRIKFIQQTGSLSACADNPEVIKADSLSGFLKGREFMQKKIPDSWFPEQFKRIDFSRGIKIINTGSMKTLPGDKAINRNTIYAGTDSVFLANAIAEFLKKDLDRLYRAVSIPEENTGEVR